MNSIEVEMQNVGYFSAFDGDDDGDDDVDDDRCLAIT